MACCFFAVINGVFNYFINLVFIDLNKKLHKHIGGVLHRVWIVERIVQFYLIHSGKHLPSKNLNS